MMYAIKHISLLLLLLYSSFTAGAQDRKDLSNIVSRLKQLRNYSYQTETKAVFPNGRKEEMHTELSMDGSRKRLFYKTDKQLLLLTDKWAFKADHFHKQVSVFHVASYNARYRKTLPELQEIFDNGLTGNFLDSVLLKSATIKSAKQEGPVITYYLSFPAQGPIQEMVLSYNRQKDLPERILVKSFYPEKAGRGTAVETLSSGYTATVPETVFRTDRYFSVAGKKITLLQFRNYTISSIL